MDRFYIITNYQKDPHHEIAKQIVSYLEERGKSCLIHKETTRQEDSDYIYTDAKLIPEDTECILVLGGDGTLIQAARDVVHKKLPLLGVNLGTLGFLTEVERGGLHQALDQLINDDYSLEKRMMLRGVLYKDGKRAVISGNGQNIALNDIVIGRRGTLRIINFDIFVNEEYLYSCSADGIIISTPTGSTGYNLSAGGPIVAPRSNLILLTPICSHSLSAKSIVLSGTDKIVVKIGPGHRNRKEEAEATFDGSTFIEMGTGDSMEITRAQEVTELIKLSSVSFLEVLRKKMQNYE